MENIRTEKLKEWALKDVDWLHQDKNPVTVGDFIRRDDKKSRLIEIIEILTKRAGQK